MAVIYVVTFDEVRVYLVGPHPIWVQVSTFLCFVEGRVNNSDVHGLIDGPGGTMCLPSNGGETVYTGRMSHGLTILVGGEGGS